MSDPPEALRLFITNTGQRARLEVGGEIDLATVEAVRDHLALLVEAGTGDVDVDMAAVNFCDATVLGVLLTAQQTLAVGGRRLQIVNASASTTRLLQLAGLDTILLAPPQREPQPVLTSRSGRVDPFQRRRVLLADRRGRKQPESADRQTDHRPRG